jgi:prepilin-type N-terminal cleavage/methylation domain-containing protein
MIRFRAHLKGFTLPEVCVALAVFLIGTTALLGCWNFFNREVVEERLRLERLEEVISTMESLIAERLSCSDSTALLQISAPVLLKRIPGNKLLAWAVVERDGLALKRLVRCR